MTFLLIFLLPVAILVFSANKCSTSYDRYADDQQQLAFLRRYKP